MSAVLINGDWLFYDEDWTLWGEDNWQTRVWVSVTRSNIFISLSFMYFTECVKLVWRRLNQGQRQGRSVVTSIKRTDRLTDARICQTQPSWWRDINWNYIHDYLIIRLGDNTYNAEMVKQQLQVVKSKTIENTAISVSFQTRSNVCWLWQVCYGQTAGRSTSGPVNRHSHRPPPPHTYTTSLQ